MRKLSFLIAVLALAVSANANEWSLDKTHSQVGFKVKHLVIAKTSGKFDKFDGKVWFDGKDFTSGKVEFTADVASINTENEKRDAHLKSSDFFAADSFPTMTFVSTKVSGVDANNFKIDGNLTIRGVTKPVTFDAVLNGVVDDPWTPGGKRAGFSATTFIDRFDFGLHWNNATEAGGLIVDKKVEIAVDVEVTMGPKK